MLQSVQACRALALVSVVVYHAGIVAQLPRYGTVLLPFDVENGRLGVDFFFIISGFIICFAHHADLGRAGALPHYAWRRFARIYPLYWIMTLVTVLALAVLYRELLTYGPLDVLSMLTLQRFSSSHFPVGQAWSLSNEVIFYTLFAIMLVHRRLGMVVLGVWFAACFFANTHGILGRSVTAVVLNFRNLGFFAGILVYLLHERVRPALGPWLVAAAVALVAIGVPLVPDLGLTQASVLRGYYLLPFALFLLGVIACERGGALRVPAWIGFLGNASYSIYLSHMLVLYAVVRVGGVLHMPALIPPVPYWLLVSVAGILPGCLLYVLLERPLLARLRGIFPDGPSKGPVAHQTR